jgi:ArsR family transcriptional regulator
MTRSAAPDDLISALGDATRLRALQIVWDGDEHCVCELMEALDATQSRMSRHMSRLKSVGLLIDRRDAQWVRYRRNPDLPVGWAAIIDAVLAALPPRAEPDRLKRAA